MSTILEIEKQNTTKGWHAKDVRLINWESPKACYHHQAALDFFFLRQVFLIELRSFWDCTDYNSIDFALIFRSLVVGIQRI